MKSLIIPEPGSPIPIGRMAEIELEVARQLPSISDLGRLEEWRAQWRALEMYFRGKEQQRPALGAQRRIEARIGQLIEPQQGKKLRPHDGEVERHDRTDFRIMANALNGKLTLSEDEWRKSRRALVSYIRHELGLLQETPELPAGIFRCIAADPPWQMDTGPDTFDGTGESGHDALEYEQMSLEEIKALPVQERLAEDAHLYLWTTNRYLEAAYDVARAWDFKPSVLLVWAKSPHGVGLGDAFRLTTEFVLFARRGHLKESCIVETTWFNWPRGRHSKKPREFYELAETVSPANGEEDRLEMFAREPRKGCTVWGEEISQ
jgi:N6-adenosine-specific RNA methylase IME4